jgi:hypothetical protein
MSQDKLNKVINFSKPVTFKDMKSFIGLVNHFREHVRGQSYLIRPLTTMIQHYDKSKARFLKLQWTEECDAAFRLICEAVAKCQKLFFMDNDAPVFLHTDASDYCVGAYLFQVMNEQEQPIRFLSQALSGNMLRWDTFDKEGYAIFYAFQQLDYLLRDRFFTLRTDHRNLTYVNKAGSNRVYRWKCAFQEFDFNVEHILGKDNIAADILSRAIDHTDYDPEVTLMLEEVSFIMRNSMSIIVLTIPVQYNLKLSQYQSSVQNRGEFFDDHSSLRVYYL